LLPAPISEGPAQEQQVPDEVRNTKAALATAPMLMLAEELSFGAEESVRALSPDSYQLRVNGEGRVYILDAPKAIVTADEYNEQAPRVWIFEPNGRFTRSIAQGGALRSPRNFAVARDSVIVFDFPPRGGRAPRLRHQVFAADGRKLGTHDYTGGALPSLDPYAPAFHGTAKGWVAVGRLRVKAPRGERLGPYHDSILILDFLPTLAEVRTILSYPSAPLYLSEGGWITSPVLSSHPRHAVGADGRIYLHPGATYVIEVRSHDGTLERRIRGEVDLIEVTEEDFEKEISRETDSESESKSMWAAIERNARRAGRADYRPVLGAMWASRDGSILVERLDLAPDAFASAGRTQWDVFGPDGRVAGRLETPAGIKVQAFEWPHVYAIRRADEQSEAVRFRITAR